MRLAFITIVLIIFSSGIFAQEIDTTLNGPYQKIIKTTRVTGYHVNGLKDRTWVYYNLRTDAIESIENYYLGKKNGLFMTFEGAKIKTQKFYQNDSLHGLDVVYNNQGKKISKTSYAMGQLSGLSAKYYESGYKLETSTYRNNLRNGKTAYYNEEGKKIATYDYTDGELDGEVVIFYSNGNEKSHSTYNMGVQYGDFKEQYPTGRPKVVGQYDNGEKTGKWIEYGSHGEIISEKEY